MEIETKAILDKRWWRSETKKKQAKLSDVYMNDASTNIGRVLRALPEYRKAKTIMLYVSVGKEVMTNKIMLFALQEGKRVCLPLCTDTENSLMEARLWNAEHKLVKGEYGIPAPAGDSPRISEDEIDLVVLPCVACDRECNRLGHGAGYYDRFIEKLSPVCGKIALCYEKIIADKLPTESHDVPMDAVITEKEIYRSKQ